MSVSKYLYLLVKNLVAEMCCILYKNSFFFLGACSDLTEFIMKNETTRLSCCTLCPFQSKIPAKVKNHLEAIHFPGLFLYSCSLCTKTFKGRNALGVHMSTVHNNAAKYR